jgi:TrpR-related protein YerC/YecD
MSAKPKAKATRERLSNQQRALFRALLALSSIEECERFMIDLCTPTEIAALADRWWVAQLVARKVPYREIQARTGVSTATVTRVARALMYGENGYRTVLDKTKTVPRV